MIYSFFIRFFVVLGIISSLIIENVEYKSALIILSIIYLLFFSILVITSEGKRNLKFIFYAVDIAFLSFMIYITGLTYLSNFVIPFFSEFTEGKDEYTYYGILSVIPIGLSLYLSNFSDYIFLPLILSGLTAIYKVKREFEEKEWHFKKIKSQMDKLYRENLKLQEEILENQVSIELLPVMQSIIKQELSLKEGLFELNEYFRAKGIALIDFVNHKCISVGDAECKKESLAFIKDEIQVLTSKETVEALNCKKAYSIVISNKEDLVYGILFILFDDDIQINENLLRVIKDYLDFYFSKITPPEEIKNQDKEEQ
jgi:hypothetical protein